MRAIVSMIRIQFGHRKAQPSPAAAAAIGEDKQCGVCRNNQAGVGQEGIYYKWASVKMTLKFHFLWSTLF